MPSWVLILMMLIFGTWNTLNTKTQFSTCAPSRWYKPGHPTEDYKTGRCPKPNEEMFTHAWQTNLYMFFGEACLLIVHYINQAIQKRREPEPSTLPIANDDVRQVVAKEVPFYYFAIPASCDVLGSGFAAVGQLWLDAAIWQMLRSAIIVFSAIISVTFLKKKIACFRWVGVFVVMVGLMTVGLADILDAGSGKGSTGSSAFLQAVGFGLTIGAQGLSAFQMVFEEKLLTGEMTTTAERTVGFEGCFGFVLTGIVIILTSTVISGTDHGHFESIGDGVYMLSHSSELMFLAITFALSIGVYNCVGIMVGKQLSAVVRCMADSCRTVTVWIVSLIQYQITDGREGVTFEPHTWLELVGFVILSLGTAMYNDLLPEWIIPPHWKGDTEQSQDERAGSSADIAT